MRDDHQSDAESAPLSNEMGPAKQRQPALHQLVTAVCAPALSLSGRDGQIRLGGAEGLYVRDVRVLSELIVTVDGEEPLSVGLDIEGGSHNRFEATVFEDSFESPDPVVFLCRRRTVNPRGMSEELEFTSRARVSVVLHVRLRLSCDLAAIATVKSGSPTTPVPASAEATRLHWGRSDVGRVAATVTPTPDRVDPHRGSFDWEISLEPGASRVIVLSVSSEGGVAPVVTALRPSSVPDASPPPVSLEASDPRLVRMFERSLADLAGLTMATSLSPDDAFVAAGAPWYLTLFGRDAIWAARMMLPLGTDVALGTLRSLARRQGEHVDHVTNEEPGKILHELRTEAVRHDAFTAGPDGTTTLSLPPVYYGTVDATPLWVCLLHDAWRWGAPASEIESLLTPMERCLDWIVDYGCRDRPFLSYVDETGHGLTNQGWKDSSDGVQYRDGRLATAPIALCEAQGYAYEAAMHGADLLDAFARPGADRWREFARDLALRFRDSFWVTDADGPYPAIALDAHGAPVDSLSSNIGHLLGTGLLNAEEEQLVAARLGGPDLDSGFGLRTLAASSKGFNPLSYHCGSVWAHDTAIAITGLRTVPGRVADEAAASLIEGLLAAAAHFDYRLPELYAGDARIRRSAPRTYPASCHPQAWAAASAISIVAAVIGIRPDVPHGTVTLSPLVHHDHLSVNGLRLAGQSFSVQFKDRKPPQVDRFPPGLRLQG